MSEGRKFFKTSDDINRPEVTRYMADLEGENYTQWAGIKGMMIECLTNSDYALREELLSALDKKLSGVLLFGQN